MQLRPRSLLTLIVLTAVPFLAVQGEPNKLTPEEAKAGWRLLFDGKSRKGWEARSTFDKASTGDWSVKNGAIACGGTKPGWIHTDDSFSDFQLRLEFRGAQTVNSGVFLRSSKEGEPHKTGYELQIWDTQPAGFNTGSLVGSVKAPPAKLVGGEWNTYDITAKGSHFLVVLNGKTVLDANDPQHKAGVIGFQCQVDNPIEFRSIRVRAIR